MSGAPQLWPTWVLFCGECFMLKGQQQWVTLRRSRLSAPSFRFVSLWTNERNQAERRGDAKPAQREVGNSAGFRPRRLRLCKEGIKFHLFLSHTYIQPWMQGNLFSPRLSVLRRPTPQWESNWQTKVWKWNLLGSLEWPIFPLGSPKLFQQELHCPFQGRIMENLKSGGHVTS